MAKGPKYKVPKRRRREGKTNYYKRYKYILSGKLRLVVRKTNKYIWAQVVKATPIGDVTIVAAHSRELVKKFGWKAGCKNIPAAYLVGFLVGLRAVKARITEAIPDIGLHRAIKGAKVFAVIKGANDAGMKIPVSEEIIPTVDRIRGETIAKYAEMLANNNPEKFNKQFSQLLSKGFDPRKLPEHFEEIKSKIMQYHKAS